MRTSQRPPWRDAEALIREARRRQRRRRLLIGLAAAVLAGAAGMVAGVRPGGQPRPRPPAAAAGRQELAGPIPHSVGTTVLMWPVVAQGEYPAFGPHSWPPAYVDNLATGHLSRRHKLAFAGGDYRPYLVQAGHWLVYVGGQGATAISDDLQGRPRVLGATPFLAPAASPGHIWLERIRGDLGEGGQASVWQVSVRTGHRSPVITLPRNAGLIAGTDAGLLLQVLRGHDFALALWRHGSTPRALPYSPWQRDGLDASPRLVAYGTGCQDLDTVKDQDYYEACSVLRVFDVVTARLLSFPAPPGTAGWMPSEIGVTHAIAPGGRMIAAYAATRPLGKGQDRLYVMRITGATGRLMAVPASAARLDPSMAWSADGSWLFYQGPRERMWAYQASSGHVRGSTTSCCPYTVMAAFPSGRR
jgi:hypothetical protein